MILAVLIGVGLGLGVAVVVFTSAWQRVYDRMSQANDRLRSELRALERRWASDEREPEDEIIHPGHKDWRR